MLATAMTAACVVPASALAADSSTEVVDQLDQAVAVEQAAPAAANAAVELPSTGADNAALSLPGGEMLTMRVPADGDASGTADTAVFEGTAASTTLAVQSTAMGLRALISIDSPAAPERYTFPIGGDVVSLSQQADGGVVALNADGDPIAQLAAPWARDANGRDVPTRFEVEGTTVVQVVEHRGGDFAYGITADPWWNPFSWSIWRSGPARALGSVLSRCGAGALKTTLGLGAGTVSVNIVRAARGLSKLAVPGYGWGYVAVGVAGCVENQF